MIQSESQNNLLLKRDRLLTNEEQIPNRMERKVFLVHNGLLVKRKLDCPHRIDTAGQVERTVMPARILARLDGVTATGESDC
jgi:hypothetical protein